MRRKKKNLVRDIMKYLKGIMHVPYIHEMDYFERKEFLDHIEKKNKR